jgi:zinc transport system substrate-binding protein
LRIGVTLHPYYSWTANIIAGIPGAEVVPVLPGEIDAGNYQPSPDDIAKLAHLDAIVINGIGHDDFIRPMIKASGNDHLVVIAQSKLIARRLGQLRPAAAATLSANARAYGDKLRAIEQAAAAQLAHAKIKRVVTVHDGYTYLLQEFGIELAGVVQPAHGLTPSAKELADMIALVKAQHITIVLTEQDFPAKLLATLTDATNAKVYIISHVAVGDYSPTEFETVMSANAATLVKALVTDPP